MRIWDNVIYEIKERKLKRKIVTMATALLMLVGLMGVKLTQGSFVTTSSTVGDRELPIYCVDTQEPKIALTFDAAWGNIILC